MSITVSHVNQAMELWKEASKIQVMSKANGQKTLVAVLAMSETELEGITPLLIIIQDYLKSIEHKDGTDKGRTNKTNK